MSETPILDLEQDPPRERRFGMHTSVGALFLVVVAFVLPDHVSGFWWFPILYASVALHEIGHLIAGKLVGMEAGGIVVGGLMFFKSGGRWRFRFDYRRILSGGLARPLARKTDFDPARFAWMVAGGPLTNIVLAVIAGIVFWKTGSALEWVGSVFWLNVILFAGTLLPVAGVNKSDGARLWMLLRNREESRSWIALLQLITEESSGVRPRDWDEELVAQMLQYNPLSGDSAFRHMLLFCRKNDQGDRQAALEHLEKALAASGNCGRQVRYWCFAEAACSSAMLRHNPVAARAWVERAAKIRKPVTPHNIAAFLGHCEGRYADALKAWAATLAFLGRKKQGSGLSLYITAKMEEYRDECREALNSKQIQSVS